MEIKSLKLNNFKCFSGEHVFNLDNPPGLYYLTGWNEAEPRLKANGVGKSTLWDAVYWCLYGRSLRGLRAGNICNWKCKGKASVELVFNVGDTKHTLYRQWGPNELTLDGSITTDMEIVKLVGLDSIEFQTTVIAGQFGDMFFDLKPTAKLEMFADVLRLSYWVDKSAEAKDTQDKVIPKIDEVRQTINRQFGKKSTLEEQIENYKGSVKRFDKEHGERIDIINKRLDFAKAAKRTVVTEKKTKLKDLEVSLKAVSAADAVYRENGEILDQIRDRRSFIGEQISRVEGKLYVLEEEIGKFANVEGNCPYCGQEVTAAHIKKETKKLKEKQRSLEEERDGKNKNYDKINDNFCDTEDIVVNLRNKLEGKRKKVGSLDREIAVLTTNISNSKDTIVELENELADLCDEENPFKGLLHTAEQNLKNVEANIARAQGKHAELQKKFEAYKYWVKGFKDIRLLIIDEALDQLEIEVNNSLLQLGLVDWSITFDVERETSTGGITKGFQVIIHSPDNPKPVPWEAWSGGESQRLRLAGAMGLSNLILTRKSIITNMEVYDEPSKHMGAVTDLMDTLYQRAIDTNKQIWLVDHNSIDYGGFAGVVHVVKDINGSSFTYNRRVGE